MHWAVLSASERHCSQQAHGVDLRCGLTVTALEGDAHQSFFHAQLFGGNFVVEADVALTALGSIRNVELAKRL